MIKFKAFILTLTELTINIYLVVAVVVLRCHHQSANVVGDIVVIKCHGSSSLGLLFLYRLYPDYIQRLRLSYPPGIYACRLCTG